MDLTETAVFRLSAKQVDRLFNNTYFDVAGHLIASTLLLAVAWFTELRGLGLALCVLPALLAILRAIIANAYGRKTRPSSSIKKWEGFATAGIIGTALAWGLLGGYFAYSGQTACAVCVLAIAVVTSIAGTVFYAGFPSTTISYAIAAMAPPAIAGAIRADLNGSLLAGGAITGFVLMFLSSLIVKRLIWASISAQQEVEHLTGHLDQRKTQVEKLNVALKTNTDKREQAEITLRRTAADLGLVQGKAKALADTLERVSPLCQVTGLSNRRHFDEQMDKEWRRAVREQKPMSLVIAVIDEFEAYAEHYGMQSSDALLKKIAQSMKGFGRRSGDLAGRYEDEKLAIMLPSCDARNAVRMAEALRKRIEGAKIAHAAAKNRTQITVHIGVATIKPSKGLEIGELQKRADAALYEARFQGGNKIVAYKPLSKLKLERWDQPSDGSLNEQSLTQKILVWGYDTSKRIIKPDDAPLEHAGSEETVIAILTGEMVLDIEGHSMAIKPGDCVFVPADIVITMQAAGNQPVVTYAATKSA